MAILGPLRKIARRAGKLWRSEDSLRRRLANIGHLLTGNLFASFIGMLGFVVTARALGPTDYGILALTYSYVRTVERLVGFQSWQPLIKYGAELSGKEDGVDYRSLLKFGLFVDAGAAFAACVTAIGAAILLGPLIGIASDKIDQVIVYSAVLLFQINGLPTAVMRLSGRFRLVAYVSAISGAVRLAACFAGLIFGFGLFYFVCAWAFSQLVGALLLLGLALVQMRRQGTRRILSAPLAGITTRFKGIIGFTVSSNVELTIRSSANELDVLLVGLFTTPAAAGLYHVAKRLARVVLQIGVQVQAVIYPDIARLWAQNAIAEFRRTVLQTEILLACCGVLLVLGTAVAVRPALSIAVGPDFVEAAPLVVVQMIAVAITLSGSAMRTAMLAMGKQYAVLKVVSVATIVFHLTALTLVPTIGAVGANIAHVLMGIVWICGLFFVYRRETSGFAASVPKPSIQGA